MMKALTLTQPWATLVANGKKQIETRSWSTKYRGTLLIHAAKGFPTYAQEFAREVYGNPAVLPYIPRGCIVAKVYLLDVCHVEDLTALSVEEARYGDYSPGRFAWIFSNIQPTELVSCKGALGLWDYDEQILTMEA